jgi:hypothetical protein
MGWINSFKHGINYLKDSFNPMGLIHIKEERSRVMLRDLRYQGKDSWV